MTDLRPTIVPKSDQLNADDLIGRNLTVRVTKVSLCGEADQPIAVHFEGDGGKPYKPCKSMRRVMVSIWGPDGNAYAGRWMTLYRDDKVQFGGLAVGGIRISHMSHIDRDVTMALTATRANRKPYTVRPLRTPEEGRGGRPSAPQDGDFPGDHSPPREPVGANNSAGGGGSTMTLQQRVAAFDERLAKATDETKANSVWAASAILRNDLDQADPEEVVAMEQRFNARIDELRLSRGANQESQL